MPICKQKTLKMAEEKGREGEDGGMGGCWLNGLGNKKGGV